jgi:hypothetical protein
MARTRHLTRRCVSARAGFVDYRRLGQSERAIQPTAHRKRLAAISRCSKRQLWHLRERPVAVLIGDDRWGQWPFDGERRIVKPHASRGSRGVIR